MTDEAEKAKREVEKLLRISGPVPIDTLQPREDVIRHLEAMLEHAKSGELIGLRYVAIWHGGSVAGHICGDDNDAPRRVIGEMFMLMDAVKDRIYEQYEDEGDAS